MARVVSESRPSPTPSSATGSCIIVDELSASPSESKHSPSTRPTSVSSTNSGRVEKPKTLGRSSGRSPLSKSSARNTMSPKTKSTPGSLRKSIRPKASAKTRRFLTAPLKSDFARKTSPTSAAPLLGPKSKETRKIDTAKSAAFMKAFFQIADPPVNRQLSGETLVADDEKPTPKPKTTTKTIHIDTPKKQMLKDGVRALDMGWNIEKLAIPIQTSSADDNKSDKRRSTRVGIVAGAVAATASSLGKRGRDALGSGKGKLQSLSRTSSLRGPKANEPNKDDEQRPSKRTKLSVTSAPNSFTATEERLVRKPVMSRKTWLSKGLYVGQQRGVDVRLTEMKGKKVTEAVEDVIPPKENKVLPMPMFGGEYLLKRGREFRLPFDVYSPLPPGQPRPDEWWKKQSNRFIGEAATEWRKTKPLPPSSCLCSAEDGCADDCQNRYMLYECDEDNCSLGPEHCTNRAFADLKERSKSGKKYAIGVEVMKTAEKGFGVRACRTFEPNQIIVEYTGEIITQEECERRMREEYKDNECYYLMTFDQNMIIDATRGSIARFINHSCQPNCRMVKWTVAGKPRMALFAGDDGIMTGEELTYDYNFDPFSQKNVQTCRCGAPRCRGVLGPRGPKEKEMREKEKLLQKSAGMVAGAKRKLQSVFGGAETGAKKQPEKKKPRGSGVWGGNWEWVKK